MANPPAKQAPVSSAPKVMQGGGAKNKNQPAQQNQGAGNSNSIVSKVLERLRTCDNVLVTLSKNPTIDELTAALGFTYILDKIGKHVTAIFSGAIPNIIEFLEPEKTFEQNTNSLQDFIIAINKEKADHLRYKIEGDYVKVFITPYKTTITESDMEFSHGDYNVDLVVALNVPTEDELDAALTEYGRIKHDASSINISAHEPAKFGDLEWGDPESSSVSEMIARLASHIRIEGIEIFDKTIATTLLTGIIAATNRFSNERTSAETMAISAKLLGAGADQQLISSNVPVDILTTEPEPAPAPAAAEAEYDEDTVLADDVKDESETVAEAAARATERAKAVEEARRKAAEEKIAAAKAAKAAKDPTAFMIDHSEKAESTPEPVAIEEPEPIVEPEPVVETAPVEPEPAAEAAPAETSAAEEADRIATQTRQESGEQSGPSVDELIAARQAIEDRLRAELGNGQGASDAARANASVNELDHALATAAAAAPISPASVVVEKVNLDGTAVPAATIDAAAAAAVPQIASAGGGVKHVIEPSKPEENPQNVKDYGALMDAALGESASAPAAPTAPVVSTPDIAPATVPAMPEPAPVAAPAAVTVAPAAVAMPPVAPVMQAPVAPAPAPAPVAAPTPAQEPALAPMPVAEPAEAPIADVDFAPEPAPVAPEPAAPQVSFTMPEPTAAQLPTMPAPSIPDLNQILPPPPPAPFTPAAPEPVMPSPSGAVDMSAPAGDIQLPVVPIQPATFTEAGDDTPKGNPTNNVYPDPAAFHIPGM